MSLDINTLFASFPSGLAQGLLWGIMALGLYITFRMLNFADMTVDGTFTTGGAVAVMLIIGGWNPWLAVIVSFLAGLLAGLVTGFLHTKLGIPAILSGQLILQSWVLQLTKQSLSIHMHWQSLLDLYQMQLLQDLYVLLSL